MGRAPQFEAPDLSGITDRAARDYNWQGNDEATAVKWYVAFLALVYKNPGGQNYIVTTQADQLWHTHMTFTVRYRQYCESVLGFFLDHTPLATVPVLTEPEIQAVQAAYQNVGKVSPDLIVPCG